MNTWNPEFFELEPGPHQIQFLLQKSTKSFNKNSPTTKNHPKSISNPVFLSLCSVFFVSASFLCYFGVSPAILRGQQRTTDPLTDMRTLAILCTSRLESLVALVGGLACAPLVSWVIIFLVGVIKWDPISWLKTFVHSFSGHEKTGILFLDLSEAANVW